jgi:tetratricopeptide (TPR) repeat protein
MLTTARRVCIVLAIPFLVLAFQFWPQSNSAETSLDERAADCRFEEGVQALARGDSDKTVSCLTDAIDRYSDLRSSAVHQADLEMGRALGREGGFSSARLGIHLNEEARLEPKLADAYCQRGVAYNRKGDFAHALADFKEASKTKRNRTVIEGRALANRNLGDLKAAEADEKFLAMMRKENSIR